MFSALHDPHLQSVDILLVDDDESDVLLTKRSLENGKIANVLHVVNDGVEAMEFLRQTGRYIGAPRPDLILLDLNMPRKDGREVLADIKCDPHLHSIPVVILTTSDSEQDVADMYDLHANCYVTKPVDLAQFFKIVTDIKQFWFSLVKLPSD